MFCWKVAGAAPAASAPAAPASAAPAPAAAAPVAPAPAPLAAAPASPELEVDRILADLSRLRARRRFADAAAMLEQALASGLPSTTLERLSYELGDIRTHQLADPEHACRHWQSHRARFPQGRYTDEVAAAVRRLRCQETTP